MATQNTKELQHHSSTPFLLRFSGKVSQVNKQGTFISNLRELCPKPQAKSKTTLTMLQRKADNVLLDLSEIKRKNDRICSQTFESKGSMTPMGRSSKRGPAEEDKPLFYIDYALPGNINMSMDFRDMLDKLTEIEKINRVR